MFTVVIFILVLGLLVFVHEAGHFITARKSGMKVYEFGFGFPPRAFGVYKDPKTGKYVWVWKKSKKSGLKDTVGGEESTEEYPATLYSINWLPIGGFVKIKGENGEGVDDEDSFVNKKAWKKILVLSAGVVMNFILAALLLGTGFIIGLPTDISDGMEEGARIVEGPMVLVQTVEDDSPAEEAGILFGDNILSVDGVAMNTMSDVSEYIKEHGGQELTINVKRVDENIDIAVTPTVFEGEERPRVGLVLADAAIISYPWYIAIYKGFIAAGITTINIVLAFYFLIKSAILGHGMTVDVAGPVGIAVLIGQSARMGLNYLLNITAMISLSLAVINILPIPALDGGRILFILIEKITKRPVPMKYEQMAHTVGFLVLMLLIILVTGRDILGLLR